MPTENEHYTETDLDLNEDLDWDSDDFTDELPSDQWGQPLDDYDNNENDDLLRPSNIELIITNDEKSQQSINSASYNEVYIYTYVLYFYTIMVLMCDNYLF